MPKVANGGDLKEFCYLWTVNVTAAVIIMSVSSGNGGYSNVNSFSHVTIESCMREGPQGPGL